MVIVWLRAREIDLSEESELRNENDDLKENSVRLETEKIERAADVKEAETIMEETLELKEEYPKLVIQNDEEAFDLDAMKRAEILIEGTRDGIMSGVKKRIESHARATTYESISERIFPASMYIITYTMSR